MFSSPAPALAGSKRCAAGNIINCVDPHQLSSDGHYPPRHINPQLLCCHPCAASHSASSKLDLQSSHLKSSNHTVRPYTWSVRDQHIDTSEISLQRLCDACVVDDNCTEQCSLPCPGDEVCADVAVCCDAPCDVQCDIPCCEDECPDSCTKISCPDSQCHCEQCQIIPCPLETWELCHVNHRPSFSAVAPCSDDITCHTPFISGPAQSNSYGQSAHIGPSLASSHHPFHGHSSNQPYAMETIDTFSSSTSTNDFKTLFNPNGQLTQPEAFSDAHDCQIDMDFEHCYYNDVLCCHGSIGSCPQAPESQNCRDFSKDSSQQSFRQPNMQPLGQSGKSDSSPHDLCQFLTQQHTSGSGYSRRPTSSNISTELAETTSSYINSLSSNIWLIGGQSSDNSIPQFLNSDLRSNLSQPSNEHMLSTASVRQKSSNPALSYPSPVSKPGTNTASPVCDYSASGGVSSPSVNNSSDDDLKDQMRSTSLFQNVTPTSNDSETYICKWEMASTSTRTSALCLHSFDSAEALHNHIKICHVDRLSGSCFCQWEGCDENHTKDFKQRSKLARHLLVHAGYRPYKCGYKGCEKTFATNQAKDNHERTHAGDKPYQCKYCPYVTTTATQLKTHINAKHIKDKCFHCRVCSFCCADSSNLSKHEKTHRSRPYRCLHPGCTFKNDCRWENVKRHFKKSGHCPELLVDDSPEQVRYKLEAAEVAKRDPLPKKVSRVRRTESVAKLGDTEESG